MRPGRAHRPFGGRGRPPQGALCRFLAPTASKRDDEDDLGQKRALARDVRVLALETDERETILAALDDPPAGFEELRATLLQEHMWRRREGL